MGSRPSTRLFASAVTLVLALSTLVASRPAAVGMFIRDGRLVQADGTPFIIRGANHTHAWHRHRVNAFAQLAAVGANTVRVVLSGGRWGPPSDAQEVADVIRICRANRLVCVLDNHDTTGFGEQQTEWSLERAADFWIGLRQALVGHEDYILINIGNEPFGNIEPQRWTAATIGAIGRLRAAGLHHVLVADAPNWGQDWQFIMRDNAQAVFDSDPDRNTLFSVHMYGVFRTEATISGYLDSFRKRDLPIVIGEFGPNHPAGEPDVDAVMSQATQRGIGYLGWVWSGGGGQDMVSDFNPYRLTEWGRRLALGPNGIRATSKPATVYGRQASGLRAHTRDRFIGFAAALQPLTDDPEYRRVAAREFNQLTPENALKWDVTEPFDGAYEFDQADQLIAFAKANNQIVHGHTLVWHRQTPQWVQRLAASDLREALRNHVATVVGRYAADPAVRSWDVVNEPLADDGSLRNSFWLRTLGPGYIAEAFRLARAADPDAKLCLNDYGIEGLNAKSDKMFELIKNLHLQGVRVDCLGIQGHLTTEAEFPAGLVENMQRFASLGIELRITELDVRVPIAAGADRNQSEFFERVVGACLAVPACTGITLWGFTDRYSWIPQNFPGEGKALIFDESYRPKDAYRAVRDALAGS